MMGLERPNCQQWCQRDSIQSTLSFLIPALKSWCCNHLLLHHIVNWNNAMHNFYHLQHSCVLCINLVSSEDRHVSFLSLPCIGSSSRFVCWRTSWTCWPEGLGFLLPLVEHPGLQRTSDLPLLRSSSRSKNIHIMFSNIYEALRLRCLLGNNFKERP